MSPTLESLCHLDPAAGSSRFGWMVRLCVGGSGQSQGQGSTLGRANIDLQRSAAPGDPCRQAANSFQSYRRVGARHVVCDTDIDSAAMRGGGQQQPTGGGSMDCGSQHLFQKISQRCASHPHTQPWQRGDIRLHELVCHDRRQSFQGNAHSDPDVGASLRRINIRLDVIPYRIDQRSWPALHRGKCQIGPATPACRDEYA